jgi:hypothetical protein
MLIERWERFRGVDHWPEVRAVITDSRSSYMPSRVGSSRFLTSITVDYRGADGVLRSNTIRYLDDKVQPWGERRVPSALLPNRPNSDLLPRICPRQFARGRRRSGRGLHSLAVRTISIGGGLMCITASRASSRRSRGPRSKAQEARDSIAEDSAQTQQWRGSERYSCPRN